MITASLVEPLPGAYLRAASRGGDFSVNARWLQPPDVFGGCLHGRMSELHATAKTYILVSDFRISHLHAN